MKNPQWEDQTQVRIYAFSYWHLRSFSPMEVPSAYQSWENSRVCSAGVDSGPESWIVTMESGVKTFFTAHSLYARPLILAIAPKWRNFCLAISPPQKCHHKSKMVINFNFHIWSKWTCIFFKLFFKYYNTTHQHFSILYPDSNQTRWKIQKNNFLLVEYENRSNKVIIIKFLHK